jgi:hypothetical protein
LKTRFPTLFIAVVPLLAFGQGTINFINVNSGSGLNSPVFLNDGTKVSGPGVTAELLAGTSFADLRSVATTGFLTGAAAGYFNGGVISIPGVPGGGIGFFQVRAWSTAAGSFEAAEANYRVYLSGQSSIWSQPTGDLSAVPPTPPPALTGLGSFGLNNLIPEPSIFGLAGLGVTLSCVRRRKQQLEAGK